MGPLRSRASSYPAADGYAGTHAAADPSAHGYADGTAHFYSYPGPNGGANPDSASNSGRSGCGYPKTASAYADADAVDWYANTGAGGIDRADICSASPYSGAQHRPPACRYAINRGHR